MNDFLVVTEPFDRFARGDAIRAGDQFDETLAKHPDKVVRVYVADTPSAAPGVSSADTTKPE